MTIEGVVHGQGARGREQIQHGDTTSPGTLDMVRVAARQETMDPKATMVAGGRTDGDGTTDVGCSPTMSCQSHAS